MQLMTVRSAVAGALLAFAFAAPGFAQEGIAYTAELKGASEVPPVETAATGMVDASFDAATKTLTWTISYDGLSGPASAAHFHGPAAEGENAPPVIPIEGDLASPIEGSAVLTDEQVADLQAGRWYFNVHTEANTGGEIRGQLTQQR